MSDITNIKTKITKLMAKEDSVPYEEWGEIRRDLHGRRFINYKTGHKRIVLITESTVQELVLNREILFKDLL